MSLEVLSPKVLSPEFHVHFHADNSCNSCCPSGPRRMIPKDERTLVPDTTNKIVLWLLNHCCCCLPLINPTDQNKQAARMYDSYLKQQYGELIAKTSLRRAGVDLESKKETGAPFNETEATAIRDKAEAIQEHMDSLKQIVKHLAYYNEKIKFEKNKSREIEVEPKPGKRSPSPREANQLVIQIAVQKRGNKIEKFQAEKIKSDLQNLPFEETLTEKQINKIVKGVKTYLAELGAQHVSSETIREIVIRELEKKGVDVPRPPLFDEIDGELTKGLAKRHGVDELTAKECDALLELIESNKIRPKEEVIKLKTSTD